MTDEKQLVAVVIPIYRPTLSTLDRVSLSQTVSVLGSHPLVVVHPEGLDTSALAAEFPQLEFKAFAPEYFDGVAGYNRFMLSEDFYSAFLDYEYILIAQLDVYVFRDELDDWCRRGYDYVGAPWLGRDVYRFPLVRQFVQLYSAWKRRRGQRTQFDRYGRVGNGGFSLRRVKSHLDVLRQMPDVVRLYADTNNRRHLFNEDTFWGMEPRGFRYPSQEEAMLFSYNKYPALSYRLTGGAIPFGCHGWTKPRYMKFWTQGPEKLRIKVQ